MASEFLITLTDVVSTPPSVDRYDLLARIGRGSYGDVFKCCLKTNPNRVFAMKVRSGRGSEDPQALERFQKEIFILNSIVHPNVVRGYELIKEPNWLAFTMEFVDGGTLVDRLKNNGPIPVPEAIRVLQQLARALVAVHAEGVVHCDLKPDNILFTSEGDLKLSDFSIAELNSAGTETRRGPKLGTPDYASPEYLESGIISAGLDIYAFGLLAIEMLTGSYPFKAQSLYDRIATRLSQDVIEVQERCPEAPRELCRIIQKATCRKVENRYATAEQLVRDLDRLQRGQKSRVQRIAFGLAELWERRSKRAPETAERSQSFVSDGGGPVYVHRRR